MPRFDDINADEEVFQAGTGGGAFQFSAVRPDELSETEYTLVTILIDITGSVARFAGDLLQALKTVVGSCSRAPRADNLLVRVLVFNSVVGAQELHGFRHLRDIDVDADYQAFDPDGLTPLHEATFNGIGATVDYGRKLVDLDYGVNAVVHIITDGDNNEAGPSPRMIAELIETARREELVESLQVFLIGINTSDARMAQRLDEFHLEAKLDGFLDFGEATPARLAKLAKWQSRSISSTSQSLGTGQAAAAPALSL